MELTSAERMLLELLQEKDVQMQREAQQRRMRFMAGVAERTGIPVDALRVHPHTGAISDARIAVDEPTIESNGHAEDLTLVGGAAQTEPA